MVSLAVKIQAEANICMHTRWLTVNAVMTATFKSEKQHDQDHTDAKEIRQRDHFSLLAPSRSNASGISSFLLSTKLINRGVACTELQLVQRDIGADIPTNAFVSRAHHFPRFSPDLDMSQTLTVTPHFHAADNPSSRSDPA